MASIKHTINIAIFVARYSANDGCYDRKVSFSGFTGHVRGYAKDALQSSDGGYFPFV
jgi:hypothetical protein